jgi:hypothetical protein
MLANSSVVGANHAGEFIRRYSPQVGNKISWDNTDIVSLAGVGRIVGVG